MMGCVLTVLCEISVVRGLVYNDGCLVMSLCVYVCDDGLSGILCGSSCVVVLSGKKCERVML